MTTFKGLFSHTLGDYEDIFDKIIKHADNTWVWPADDTAFNFKPFTMFLDCRDARFNVYDNDTERVIEVYAPGFDKSDIVIEQADRELKISGKSKQADEKVKRNFVLREASAQSFERSFTIPKEFNLDAVSASYKDGVLTVTIERAIKQQEKVSKRIEVK